MLYQLVLETLFILVFPVYKFDHVFIVCLSPPLPTETNRASHICSNSVSLELKNVDQVFWGVLKFFGGVSGSVMANHFTVNSGIVSMGRCVCVFWRW